MFARRCNLKGRRGIKRLDHEGVYAIIANRALYDRSLATRFAIVNAEKYWVENVYGSHNEARSALQALLHKK